MYKLLQQHKKKLMAVFGIMLMVVFILPSSLRNTQSDRVVGYVGDKPLYASQLLQAENDWKVLTGQSGIQGAQLQRQTLGLTGLPLADAMKNRPELWAMLLVEAQNLGVSPDPQMQSAMLTYYTPPNVTPSMRKVYAQAITSLLQVSQAAQYVATLPKNSQPRIQQTIASQYQVLTLSAIELDSNARLDQAPAPTEKDIDQQLATFGNTPVDRPTTDNPFGFGYQFPARMKVQYLLIPEAEVRRAVLASRSDYDWKVEYNIYYQKNLSQFPTTAPAIADSTQPAGMGPIAPTTKPAKPLGFEDYQKQIENAVLQPLIDRKQQEIQDKLSLMLNEDYQKATHAGSATTQPSDDFKSFAYLKDVQQRIQKAFGVKLTIDDRPQWLDGMTLYGLPIYHEAYQVDTQVNSQGQTEPVQIPAVLWLFQHSTPLAQGDTLANHADLPLLQPSIVFRTPEGGRVIFRVTDAHMPRAPLPSEIEQVLPQVKADLRMKAAYEITLKVAQDLKAQAAKSGQNLATLAKATGRNLVDIGPIQRGMVYNGMALPDSITGYEVADVSKPHFVTQAYDMLRLASESTLHPQDIIQLQHEHKVLLAQLESVRLDDSATWGAAIASARKLSAQDAIAIQSGWFEPENIVKRNNYHK